jgi:DNA polymerase
VRLFPVFHPAAALYTPSNVEVLRQDFQRLPELLGLGAPAAHRPGGDELAGDPPEGDARGVDGLREPERDSDAEPESLQLGLF